MRVSIPKRINKLIGKSELHGAVMSSLQAFEPWISTDKLPFFPEYTDHGPQHITEVLETANKLICSGAWRVFSSTDAALLVLAALLHDCAMHLTEDGFVALVAQDGPTLINDFGDRPWAATWRDFLVEATRFDGRRLNSLFGSTEPVHPPLLDPEKMTLRDRKLIGEFLRRHHHRLAHEIAVSGVPGPCSEERLTLKDVDSNFADLAGLVARSHGQPLRSCLDYLNNNFHIRVYKDVHAVFLMGLLRMPNGALSSPKASTKAARLQD